MDNKSPLDRSIFIPVLIGIIAVFGICLVLVATRLSAAQATIQSDETNTPVKYQYLGTEPVVVTLQPLETLTPLPSFTLPPPPIIDIVSPTFTPPVALTSIGLPRSTATPTSNTATAQPLGATYDDADFKFNYTGNWIPSSVDGTYQNTLHISNTIGNSVQLSFVGQKIRLAFQAGPSLGTIAIRLDSVDFTLDQSAPESITSEWESPVLVLSSHSVMITHISGGSINIDSITVVDLSTPTPTITVIP